MSLGVHLENGNIHGLFTLLTYSFYIHIRVDIFIILKTKDCFHLKVIYFKQGERGNNKIFLLTPYFLLLPVQCLFMQKGE